MSEHTTIEWCDISLSPWWGCTKVSPGCLNCYMMALVKRWKGGQHCGKDQPRLRIESFRANALRHARRATKLGQRLTVFPSMCDPLDTEVPIEWFADFLDVIRCTQALTWLFLTKRPEHFGPRVSAAAEYIRNRDRNSLVFSAIADALTDWVHGVSCPPNVWMMVSAEDQVRADQRIPALRRIHAVKRGLSLEPLLGPIELFTPAHIGPKANGADPKRPGERWIDWVIVGGESGHGARYIDIEWVRSLRNQCAAADVPFFFKQWGGRTPKARGNLLDGKIHSEVPV
jgi:protein gp37